MMSEPHISDELAGMLQAVCAAFVGGIDTSTVPDSFLSGEFDPDAERCFIVLAQAAEAVYLAFTGNMKPQDVGGITEDMTEEQIEKKRSEINALERESREHGGDFLRNFILGNPEEVVNEVNRWLAREGTDRKMIDESVVIAMAGYDLNTYGTMFGRIFVPPQAVHFASLFAKFLGGTISAREKEDFYMTCKLYYILDEVKQAEVDVKNLRNPEQFSLMANEIRAVAALAILDACMDVVKFDRGNLPEPGKTVIVACRTSDAHFTTAYISTENNGTIRVLDPSVDANKEIEDDYRLLYTGLAAITEMEPNAGEERYFGTGANARSLCALFAGYFAHELLEGSDAYSVARIMSGTGKQTGSSVADIKAGLLTTFFNLFVKRGNWMRKEIPDAVRAYILLESALGVKPVPEEELRAAVMEFEFRDARSDEERGKLRKRLLDLISSGSAAARSKPAQPQSRTQTPNKWASKLASNARVSPFKRLGGKSPAKTTPSIFKAIEDKEKKDYEKPRNVVETPKQSPSKLISSSSESDGDSITSDKEENTKSAPAKSALGPDDRSAMDNMGKNEDDAGIHDAAPADDDAITADKKAVENMKKMLREKRYRQVTIESMMVNDEKAMVATADKLLDVSTKSNHFWEKYKNKMFELFSKGGALSIIAPTGFGKTRIGMSQAVYSALMNMSDAGDGKRHLTLIAAPYVTIGNTFFDKLSSINIHIGNKFRPILGKLLTGENRTGNKPNITWKRTVYMTRAHMAKKYLPDLFSSHYKDSKTGALQNLLNCDFVVGSYEMIKILVEKLTSEEDLQQEKIVLHTVFDEFQDSMKASNKRFITAADLMDTLAVISHSIVSTSGSYTLFSIDGEINYNKVFEEFECKTVNAVEKPRERHETPKKERLLLRMDKFLSEWNPEMIEKSVARTYLRLIHEFPEFVHAADCVAHPNKGCAILMVNDTKITDKITTMILLSLSIIQHYKHYLYKQAVKDGNVELAEKRALEYRQWHIPMYTKGVMRAGAEAYVDEEGNPQPPSLNKKIAEWKERIRELQNSGIDKQSDEYKKESKELWEHVDKISANRYRYQRRFVLNSPRATSFLIHSAKGTDTELSTHEIHFDLLWYHCTDSMVTDIHAGEPEEVEECEEDEEGEPVLDRSGQAVKRMRKPVAFDPSWLYTKYVKVNPQIQPWDTAIKVTSYEHVRQIAMRSLLFKNNAKENFTGAMESELISLGKSPRVWIATQKIGVGADMPNIRKVMVLQGYYALKDEMMNQVIGRCDRERRGRYVSIETFNDALENEHREMYTYENPYALASYILTPKLSDKVESDTWKGAKHRRAPIKSAIVDDKTIRAKIVDLFEMKDNSVASISGKYVYNEYKEMIDPETGERVRIPKPVECIVKGIPVVDTVALFPVTISIDKLESDASFIDMLYCSELIRRMGLTIEDGTIRMYYPFGIRSTTKYYISSIAIAETMKMNAEQSAIAVPRLFRIAVDSGYIVHRVDKNYYEKEESTVITPEAVEQMIRNLKDKKMSLTKAIRDNEAELERYNGFIDGVIAQNQKVMDRWKMDNKRESWANFYALQRNPFLLIERMRATTPQKIKQKEYVAQIKMYRNEIALQRAELEVVEQKLASLSQATSNPNFAGAELREVFNEFVMIDTSQQERFTKELVKRLSFRDATVLLMIIKGLLDGRTSRLNTTEKGSLKTFAFRQSIEAYERKTGRKPNKDFTYSTTAELFRSNSKELGAKLHLQKNQTTLDSDFAWHEFLEFAIFLVMPTVFLIYDKPAGKSNNFDYSLEGIPERVVIDAVSSAARSAHYAMSVTLNKAYLNMNNSYIASSSQEGVLNAAFDLAEGIYNQTESEYKIKEFQDKEDPIEERNILVVSFLRAYARAYHSKIEIIRKGISWKADKKTLDNLNTFFGDKNITADNYKGVYRNRPIFSQGEEDNSKYVQLDDAKLDEFIDRGDFREMSNPLDVTDLPSNTYGPGTNTRDSLNGIDADDYAEIYGQLPEPGVGGDVPPAVIIQADSNQQGNGEENNGDLPGFVVDDSFVERDSVLKQNDE